MQASPAVMEIVAAINKWASLQPELIQQPQVAAKYEQYRWNAVSSRRAVLHVFPTQGRRPQGKLDLAFLGWRDIEAAPFIAVARAELRTAGIAIEGTKVVRLQVLAIEAVRSRLFDVIGRFVRAVR